MRLRYLLSPLLLAAAIASPANAGSSFSASIRFAPPQEQVEYIPAPPQPQLQWAPGFWDWQYGRYVWVAGHYVVPQPGYFWVADEWVPWYGGWRHIRGHWQRQRFPDHNMQWQAYVPPQPVLEYRFGVWQHEHHRDHDDWREERWR